jgi:hypothetical protein
LRFVDRSVNRKQGQVPAPLLPHALHRGREVHDEVKAVGDLLCLRSSAGSPFGIDATPIAEMVVISE